jgi:hypothetical protein
MEAVEAEVVNLRRGYQELLNRVNDIERNSAQRLDELSRAYVKIQGAPKQGNQKEISKSKAVMNLKILPEERTQFKKWNAKIVNVMSQVRPQACGWYWLRTRQPMHCSGYALWRVGMARRHTEGCTIGTGSRPTWDLQS